MPSNETLINYFTVQLEYEKLYADYIQRGISTDLDPNDKENTMDTDWKLKHYFHTGADALRVIVKSLAGNLRRPPRTLLDFPCGSGRVTRHLLAFFPAARICACDLYEGHVSFCRDVLGAEGVMSRENLDEVHFQQPFDLIFCGSLLTHLPEPLLKSALRLIDRSLSADGIAVVTFHGRRTEYIQKNQWKYVDDHLFEIAEKGVRETGFGYVDYQHGMKEKFDKQAEYGVALVRPHWVMKLLEVNPDLRVLGYAEREWDDHQDVLVFGKPGVNEKRR